MQIKKSAVLFLAALSVPLAARAGNFYAINDGSQNWSAPLDWSATQAGVAANAVPGNGDNAFITGNSSHNGLGTATPSIVAFDTNYSSPGLGTVTVDSTYQFAGTPYPSIVNQTSAATSLYATSVVLGDTNFTPGLGSYYQSAGTNTFGSLTIYSGGNYQLSGGSLTVGSFSNSGTFNVSNGATFTATGTVSGTGTVQYSGNANLAGGTISAPISTAPNTVITKTTSAPEFITGLQSWGANTTYEADLGTTTFTTPFATSSAAATLTVHANTTTIHVNLGGFTGGPHISWAAGLTFNTPGEGILDAGTQEVVGTNALSIDVADGGSMDINDNTLIVENGSIPVLTNYLHVGYNGGAWNGLGLKSTVANQNPGHALGLFSNSAGTYSMFHGANVDAGSDLIQYTYAGDTNDNGVLNSTDFNNWLGGFQNNRTGWNNGDFNYDAVVDIPNDFLLLAQGWYAEYGNDNGLQSLVNGSSLTPTQQIQADAAIASAVPEPTGIAIVAMGVGALGMRHRRRTTI